jgi:hypothetical protein
MVSALDELYRGILAEALRILRRPVCRLNPSRRDQCRGRSRIRGGTCLPSG